MGFFATATEQPRWWHTRRFMAAVVAVVVVATLGLITTEANAAGTCSGPGSAAGKAACKRSVSQVGVRYVYGGYKPGKAFDCSGLTKYGWAGRVSLPHNALQQYNALHGHGGRPKTSQLRVGDLVFSNGFGHVTMYVGGGKVVSAPHAGARVHIIRLSQQGGINGWAHVK